MKTTLTERIQEVAEPLAGSAGDYDSLMERVGDASFVLLGEASHGTHEFYRERAQITKRLIREKAFNVVAVEADWPDAYRVNRFIRGASEDADAEEALGGFKRFPQWMWRNADVLDFVGWLRDHNDTQLDARKTGFYGLDLYSLHASIEAVLKYLDKIDPAGATRARSRYGCFDRFGRDTQTYGFATATGMAPTCEDAVIRELTELRFREAAYLARDGRVASDEFFCAEQNALVIRNAERYYRTMFRGQVSSWNLRDNHMMETLLALTDHLEQFQHPVKAVLWAHNSHLGDARATEMGQRGELNLGQLVRQKIGHSESISIGFTTYSGTVTAASEWDAPAERKTVRPALRESYEALFHDTHVPRFWLDVNKDAELAADLRSERLERAIGVIYLPQTERISHYFTARLPDQFDGILHFDHTRAVEPLERKGEWQPEVQETFPTGF